MLLRMGHKVSEAADDVGYSSPSQFSREFRRHFGVSPRQWAEQDSDEPEVIDSL